MGHLQVMKRFIGYLKKTLGNYNHLKIPSCGKGIHHNYDCKWILESFTDSDWSSDRSTRRSTSSGVHALNGIILFHSIRGQRVVSVSVFQVLKLNFMDLSVELRIEWLYDYVWSS